MKNNNLTPVQQFYNGRTIFVTGGSGFMGKVLIEKLLWTCPDIKEIFILMRPKRNKLPLARIEDMFKSPMFQRIRDEKPEVMKKITPIQGDVTYDRLGLNDETLKLVCKDTSIVFHCAATLKLEANLKDAIEMNTSGTKHLLDICKHMEKLEALLHLSTAFCYADKEVLLEKVYECSHDPHDLMRCAEWMDVKTLDLVTKKLLEFHPNTYTYSKRLAEILVQQHYPNLPVAIIRPSIVTPAWREPLEGWVDSLNGPVGVMIGAGKGVIRSMMCNGENMSEIIPVDAAISGLITIAKKIATMTEKPNNIPVYNVTVSPSQKRPWAEILNMGRELFHEYPFEAGIWYPDGNITQSRIVQTLNVIFFHWLPAYLVDFLMFCFRQKRFLCHIQQRISDGMELLEFFTTRNWDFRSERFQAIYKELTPEDQELFDMDTETKDHREYMKRVILGGRQYCMKEPLSTLPKARKQLKALYVLDRSVKLILSILLLWAIFTKTGLKDYLFENVTLFQSD